MKQIFKWVGLLYLSAMLISCGSPATEPADEVEEVEEVVTTRVVEVEETAEEVEVAEEPEPEEVAPEEAAMDEEAMDEEAMVQAVDGPTYEPATTVDQAILEKSYDRAKGGEEPLLTIIEYGDFQ